MQIHTVRKVQRHKALSREHSFSISKERRIMPPAYMYVNIKSPNIKTKQNIDFVMALLLEYDVLH